MRPRPGEVLHFSEDPAITAFAPRVAPTSREATPYVWAVDAARAPDYWFPRQCPRVLVWATARTTAEDAARVLGPGGCPRVHAVEHGWLERIRTVELFAYRLPAAPFTPIGSPDPHAVVATTTVRPLGPPEPVGDLLALHADAGFELRVLPHLQDLWAAVVTSTVGFSGIRLRHAVPRPDGSAVTR